jgi:DNA repair exonuclease SbcCD ATPase subunit
LEGTKEPLSLEELHKRVENIAPNILQQVINSFVKRRILRQLDNENLYEIAHDTLAKQIASKRSDEEIALLEIERLIKNQLAFGKDLFTEKQMNVISPYQNQLNKKLNQEELQLLTDSQKAIEQAKIAKRNRTLAIWITTILFIVVVSVFGIFAYWQWQKAESAKKEAQDQANKAQIALDDFLERQIRITKKEQENKKAEKALDDLKRQIDNITKKSQEDKALDDLKRQIGELQERRKQAEEQKELEKELNDLMDIFARIDRFPRSELEKAIKELNNLLKIRFSRNQHKKAIKELNNLLQSHIFLISELEEAIKELNNLLQSDRFSRSEHKKAIKELNNLLRSYIVLIIELKEAIKELNYLLQSDRFPRSELEKAIKELNNLLQSDRFPNSRAAIQQKINELRNKK